MQKRESYGVFILFSESLSYVFCFYFWKTRFHSHHFYFSIIHQNDLSFSRNEMPSDSMLKCPWLHSEQIIQWSPSLFNFLICYFSHKIKNIFESPCHLIQSLSGYPNLEQKEVIQSCLAVFFALSTKMPSSLLLNDDFVFKNFLSITEKKT